ncbi:hypothetical protein BLA29_005253 [Euroglyphus maynei]|uniref:Uncharacterized protein n=1 Tax=Euroglyphus maynei TaxID=6958 RepID=A0A1Y3BFE9_EURMA|nr:hypothetical protein BLA29_005253 [Euroglyphus maynei]
MNADGFESKLKLLWPICCNINCGCIKCFLFRFEYNNIILNRFGVTTLEFSLDDDDDFDGDNLVADPIYGNNIADDDEMDGGRVQKYDG